MSMRPISDVRSGLNTLVDTQIGNAFPVVRKVYEHIDEIEYVAAVYATGRSRDISLRLSHTRELVEWQYTGDPEWTVLFKFSDLLGGDMVDVIEAQRLLGIQLASLQDTLVADAAIAVEAKNSALSSKVAAKASEDAAKVSELSIGSAEINANASKVAAAASATAADISANRADTRATAAAASAASASLQSVNVGTLVNTAISKAGEATTSAQTAITEAQTATTKAEEAFASAQAAAVSASDSSASAQISINAANSVGDAADLAIDAANKLQEAIASADKAKDWATLMGSEVENGFGYSAKQYAASASASANTTADIAEEIQGSIANASAFAETARLFAVAAEASATATAGDAVLTAADVVSSSANALAAETSANTIGNSAVEAAASALLAEKWANSDIEVEGGKFSAKYWASQAQSSAIGALTYRGNHSALAGNFPPTAVLGDFYRISAEGTIDGMLFRVNDAIVYNGTEWNIVGQSDVVYTVAGRKGNVVLTAADVGLDQANNTTDADKPISTAQQTALDLKSNLDGPAFTGVPVAPTADVGTNTTQLATTAFVGAEIASKAAPISHMTDDGTGHSLVSDTQAGFMSVADKAKLDGLTVGANAYTHPANHPASIITQDSSNRFVTDAEKAEWTDKQAALVSGTTLKTVNGQSLLGEGDLHIEAGSAWADITGKPAVIAAGDDAATARTAIGLGSVDNTSDADKPVSTAQQTALNLKVDTVAGKGLSTEDYSTAEMTKLAGVATGATANATDADLRDRSTHTGAQAISTVTGLQSALDTKQSTLVSGTNIKTINGESVVGSGDLVIATVTATDMNLDGGTSSSIFSYADFQIDCGGSI